MIFHSRMPFRAIFSLLGVTWAWGMVLVHSPRPPVRTPPSLGSTWDKGMAPTPNFHFKCPKGWECPELTKPEGWIPPPPKGEVEIREHLLMRI